MSTHVSCVVALFFQDVDRISDVCPITLHAHRQVHAVYLRNWMWQLSSSRAFTLNVICPTTDKHRRMYVKSTLMSISLEPGCYATSDVIELPPTFQQTTDFNLTYNRPELYDELTEGFNVSTSTIWKKYEPIISNLPKIEIPEKLGELKSMNVDELIDEISEHSYKHYGISNKNWAWYLGMGVSLVLIVSIVILMLYRKCFG